MSELLVCAGAPDWFDGSTPLGTFFAEWFLPQRLPNAAERTKRNWRFTLQSFDRHLQRPARLSDLNRDTLAAWLQARRSSPANLKVERARLLALARAAVQLGILPAFDAPFLPRLREQRPRPWTTAELNQLLAAAATMPRNVGEIPARHWWPALLLVTLDCAAVRCATGAPVATLQTVLDLTPRDFDSRHGTLAVGLLVFPLHALTVDALLRLGQAERERLLPWHLDGGRWPFHMLYRELRAVLWRAGLPHTSGNLFNRLQITGRHAPGILDRLNLALPFTPRTGRPPDRRKRDRRALARHTHKTRAERAAERLRQIQAWRREGVSLEEIAERLGIKPHSVQQFVWLKTRPLVYITSDSPRTLKRMFEERYLPLRLAPRGAAASTIAEYRSLLTSKLPSYAACDVTLDALSDEFLARYAAWLVASGKSPHTANRHQAMLLALWRYAWRKRLVDTEPRDVEKLRVPKRLPEAWTLSEVERMLAACASEPGDVCGVPAGPYWVALVLTLYFTALRIRAAASVRCADYDPHARTLLVRGEHQKHKADQLFHLPGLLVEALEATQPRDREKLFPFHTTKHLTAQFRAILQRAGLPASRRDMFHKLRRTSATLLCNVAGPAAATQHLDHSTPQLARAHYLDPRQIRGIDACNLLPIPRWQA